MTFSSGPAIFSLRSSQLSLCRAPFLSLSAPQTVCSAAQHLRHRAEVNCMLRLSGLCLSIPKPWIFTVQSPALKHSHSLYLPWCLVVMSQVLMEIRQVFLMLIQRRTCPMSYCFIQILYLDDRFCFLLLLHRLLHLLPFSCIFHNRFYSSS